MNKRTRRTNTGKQVTLNATISRLVFKRWRVFCDHAVNTGLIGNSSDGIEKAMVSFMDVSEPPPIVPPIE